MDKSISNTRKPERGQTIILVAVALLALLSMAALAIDVVTLYVARSQAQAAANAAAIAGAKMFVTSGFTSVQGGATPPVSQAEACNAATAQAQAVALQNTVAGQAAVATVTCPVGASFASNPQITVSVARTGLPTFFARIWRRASNSISATATAEAYNPSGREAPIQVSVKPWFIPNCDVNNTAGAHNPNCAFAPFVNTNISPDDGSIVNNGSFIGKTITFSKVPHNMNPNLTAGNSQYFPLDIPVNPPAAACPSTSAVSCTQVGSSTYLDNIACASQYHVTCGDTVGPGDPVTIENNNHTSLQAPATEGTQCLIHGETVGSIDGQDTLTWVANGKPIAFGGGADNPNPALQGVANISRSDSIVNVPLYDGTVGGNPLNLCQGGGCNKTAKVVGFLQLGIVQANPNGAFQAIILNAAGCNSSPTGSTVSGGGVSAVPVRLVN
ncbi:MAG: pilus assembly protein TadG-related protein [Terriglobales bacterium]